jgi:hypothetical protein
MNSSDGKSSKRREDRNDAELETFGNASVTIFRVTNFLQPDHLTWTSAMGLRLDACSGAGLIRMKPDVAAE